MDVTSRPAAVSERIAVSRPEPGPLTNTSTLLMPASWARRAAASAAICGVGRRLARTLEANLAGGRPRHHGTRGVRDGDDRVVERGLDVRLTVSNGLLHLLARLANGSSHGLLLPSGDGLLGAL